MGICIPPKRFCNHLRPLFMRGSAHTGSHYTLSRSNFDQSDEVCHLSWFVPQISHEKARTIYWSACLDLCMCLHWSYHHLFWTVFITGHQSRWGAIWTVNRKSFYTFPAFSILLTFPIIAWKRYQRKRRRVGFATTNPNQPSHPSRRSNRIQDPLQSGKT